MAFTIIQAGNTLQFLDTDGTLTDLTLPDGVTLRTDVPPRWQVYNNYVILVNTPSTPLAINSDGLVREFVPKAPRTAPILSAGSASGSLTGTYGGVRYTFIVRDAAGTLVSESDYSPASNTVSIVSANLKASSIDISNEYVTARRVYRPTDGGSVLFQWIDVEGNTVTEVQDDLPDAGLQLIASPTLGNPPRLILLKEWRNLLWGVGDVDIDNLRFTEPDAFWSWPTSNGLIVGASGHDAFGIRSLIPRREALGVGRRDQIWQVTGESSEDFRLVKLSENTGVESNESMVVYRDTVWWLWKDGVYQWDGEGIRSISDKTVSSWFKTDSYFNQDMFAYSFAVFDNVRLKYRLFLASAGSTQIDRWVEYDIVTKTWWGPHKTDAFSPTSAFIYTDVDDKTFAVTGSGSAYVWFEQDTPTDSVSTGIPVDLTTRFFDMDAPDVEKYWGELSIIGKPQSAGTISITPTVGYTDSSAQTPISYDMTKGRQRLRRLGTGKLMQLNFQHTQWDEPIELYGFQLPVTVVGRR
jgi:hypothetical protein